MVISEACILSMTWRIVSIGQGEPAMMPVRSDVRSNMSNIGCVQLGDEHGRHAVERGRPLLLDRGEDEHRVEALDHHDGRAVRERREDAEHDAEAVEERHRQTDAVLGSNFWRSPM